MIFNVSINVVLKGPLCPILNRKVGMFRSVSLFRQSLGELVFVMLESLNNQLTKLPALCSRHWILIQFNHLQDHVKKSSSGDLSPVANCLRLQPAAGDDLFVVWVLLGTGCDVSMQSSCSGGGHVTWPLGPRRHGEICGGRNEFIIERNIYVLPILKFCLNLKLNIFLAKRPRYFSQTIHPPQCSGHVTSELGPGPVSRERERERERESETGISLSEAAASSGLLPC